jgi:DNA polymerase-3 subunit alpha
MSSEPLIDIIPIMRREQDGAIITQLDYPTCESLGLIKMDFLGLRNLTVLDDAVGNVKLNRGFDLVLEDLPLDDAPSYALLGRGDTLGVFQLDGGPMRSLLRLMRPDNFEDISAVLALYRPGPMGADSHTNYALRKNKRQEITPIHPELEEPLAEILGTTHGLIVYQEQVMAIAQKVAGYTLGQADLLRRAMGKKKKEILDAEFVPFSDGMRASGYSDAAIKALWDILVPFSDYAFNKAHTAAYGLVSYWTAYLKANYPAEFMAALLTSVADDKDKMAIYLSECRRMGIQVLPPDVNESAANFTPVGTDIRFGLTAIRNVGGNVVDGIVSARTQHGKAVNFHGFLDQVPLVVCNKRVIESLIKAGAFESMGHTRRALMSVYENAVDGVLDLKRNEAHGQDDLFGAWFDGEDGDGGENDPVLTGTVPDLADWDKRTKLAFERDMLGLYVSDHPLQGLEHILLAERDVAIADLLADDGPREGMVTIAGMITNVTRKTTKRGDIWAVITVEDLEASVEVLLFPKAYDLVSTVLATDVVVKVKGRVKRDEDAVSISAQELTLPDITDAPSGPVVISLPALRCTPPVVQQLRQVLAAHPGMTEVRLRLQSSGKTTVMKLDSQLKVTPSQPLMADLKALLGPSCLAS